MVLDQWANLSWSSLGAPTSAQMTRTGSGSPSPADRFAGEPLATRPSTRSSVIAWILGRHTSIRRTVNQRLSSRRQRRCPSPSLMFSLPILRRLNRPPSFVVDIRAAPSRARLRLNRGSEITARASS